ncbi:hypothetical protein KKA09_03005 [Patescibacteria group bacterium]|nr:hypothetical protein [Patescibacteria group bacterium]
MKVRLAIIGLLLGIFPAITIGQVVGTAGIKTLTLGEMSLEQLKIQKYQLEREAERAGWEIDSILRIINREKEIEVRKNEKGSVLDPYSPEHQVQEMRPEVERLQRQLNALLEKERLIGEKLRLVQQAQEARQRIIELQRSPKFPLGWVGVGMLADGKSGTGTDSTPSQFFAEIGMRLPAGKKYGAIGPFVGITHNQAYAGIEGFIPVVPPKQGDPGGSWAKIGVAYGKKVSALFGLNIGGERWQLTFRYWAGVDVELPLQFGVAYLF